MVWSDKQRVFWVTSMTESQTAFGMSYVGSYMKYVTASPDGNITTKEGYVAKYDPIGEGHWIQWSNGKLICEDLHQLMKAHPSYVFEKPPPDAFVPTAETCALLDEKPLKKRAAAEMARTNPSFNADYMPPLEEEVDEADMPRPTRRRRSGSIVPGTVNILGNHGPIHINVPPGAEKLANLATCPISQEIFRDPVVAEDGVTYERADIEKWLRRNQTSPMTRQPMGLNLVPNLSLKSTIADFATNE